MIHSSTPVSRHHSYLCQMIQKMERRFGSDSDIVAPLRNQAAHFDLTSQPYLAVRITRHSEPSIKVIQRLWDSRKRRINRVTTEYRPVPLWSFESNDLKEYAS